MTFLSLRNRVVPAALVAALLAAVPATPVLAGPGHDHGDEAPAANTKALPRFTAHSDLFEVAGILRTSELSLFVDRYVSNEPVLAAKIELESGTHRAVGKFHADHGDYSFEIKPFAKPGTYPVTLTITAGDEVDILATTLVVPDPEAGHVHPESASKLYYWIGGAALIAILPIVALLAARRLRRSRHV